MTARSWLAAAAVAAGSVAPAAGSVAPAADPAPPAYSFGTLRAMPADAAKARAEAWLKAVDKLDRAKFDAIWKTDRTVADRVLDSLLLGKPEVAAVLADARDPDAAPPTAVPAVLQDKSLDPFARANLAAAYAKALAGKRVYEEGLEALKGVTPELLADPAGFYFHKGAAEHALMLRDAAVVSLGRLLEDVADPPDRYRVTGTLLFADLQGWSKDAKDLANIGRLMDNSGRRLDLTRGGPKTQEIQKKIVFRLDEQIKKIENQLKQQQQQQMQAQGEGGQGKPNDGQCPAGGPPGPGQAAQRPANPMDDSRPGGVSGKGVVDEKQLRHYEENWGKLPEAERKKVVQDITRDLPPKYKPLIEEYFRSLNRLNGFKQ
ncbi:MAG: hypothetical protein U0871_11220 [Gemmataceae bacterium]